MYNEAAQNLMQDMMLWNEISDVLIESSYAEEKNDTEAVEKYDWKVEKLLNDNCSAELAQAITWAMKQGEDTSPFDKEGFTDSYFTDATKILPGIHCQSFPSHAERLNGTFRMRMLPSEACRSVVTGGCCAEE